MLALVLAGSAVAAVTSSMPLLILGRVLQGVAFSLYPVAGSILRDEIPADRLVGAIAMLSAMLGFGGGMGLGGDRIADDSGCLLSARVLAVHAVHRRGHRTGYRGGALPARPRHEDAAVDWCGGLGLAVGLSAMLLTIPQARVWGVLSAATLTAAAVGSAALIGWWRHSRRWVNPLVSTAMLSRRPILRTNAATLLVGMALYFSFLGLTDFVETAPTAGYGFGASVLTASGLGRGTGVRDAGRMAFGSMAGRPRRPAHQRLHQLAYGALPVLIVQDVEEHETGIATSFNAIARKVGSGIAVVGTLLSVSGPPAPEAAFATIFGLGAAAAVGTILLIGGKKENR